MPRGPRIPYPTLVGFISILNSIHPRAQTSFHQEDPHYSNKIDQLVRNSAYQMVDVNIQKTIGIRVHRHVWKSLHKSAHNWLYTSFDKNIAKTVDKSILKSARCIILKCFPKSLDAELPVHGNIHKSLTLPCSGLTLFCRTIGTTTKRLKLNRPRVMPSARF